MLISHTGGVITAVIFYLSPFGTVFDVRHEQ